VRRGAILALGLGIAAMAAMLVYAGAGAVGRAIAQLGSVGLIAISLLHLPVVALMGLAWWLVTGTPRSAPLTRVLWARLVRDAGAEVLPFSQLGGFVLGLRALGPRAIDAIQGAASMLVDLVIELAAKLPYLLAGLLLLIALAPHSRVAQPLLIAFALTAVVLAVPLCARGLLQRLIARMARAASHRWAPARALAASRGRGEFQRALARSVRARTGLSAGLLLHVLCWFLGALELWVTFRLLGRTLSAPQALAIDSAVAGLRTFGFLVPAAAGVQEASYLLACAVFGLPPALAIAASLARRGRDLLLGILTLAAGLSADRSLSIAPPVRPGERERRER